MNKLQTYTLMLHLMNVKVRSFVLIRSWFVVHLKYRISKYTFLDKYLSFLLKWVVLFTVLGAGVSRTTRFPMISSLFLPPAEMYACSANVCLFPECCMAFLTMAWVWPSGQDAHHPAGDEMHREDHFDVFVNSPSGFRIILYFPKDCWFFSFGL